MNLVISATAFGLLWLLNKKHAHGKWVFAVKGALALIGGVFFAETLLGAWAARAAATVAGWLGGLIGVSGAVVLGAVVLLGAVWAGWGLLKDRIADKPELVWLVVLPVLFLAAGGPIADNGSQLMGAVQQMGNASIGSLIGG